MQQREENVRKLRDLIKDVKVAMLTTVDAEGTLRSRPMATQEVEFDGTLWFLTWVNTAKVDEIERDHHVNVAYADPSSDKYVSVSGVARLVRDRKKAEELWTPLHKAWFPQGLDDPNLGLLRVEVQKAEYWDAPSSKVVQLAGFVKAMVTGKPYGEEGVDHQKVNLR
jgi:general stress protein 26